MKINNPKHGREITQLFKDAFMFERHHWLIPIFKNAERFDDWSLVEDTLRDHPNLYLDAEKYAAQTVQWIDENPFYPPPYKDDELENIRGEYSLGYINSEQCEVGLDPIDLTRGLFICGEPGGGKTYATLSMIDQMLKVPASVRGFNIILIQVVKRDADFFIRDYPSLRIIEYENLRYNMWHTEKWDTEAIRIKSAISVFSSSNWLGAMTQPIFKRCVRLCLEFNLKPTFTNINKMIKAAVKDIGIEGYKAREYTDKIRQRLSEFIDTVNILDGLCHYPIDEIWTKEDIILNLMDEANSFIYRTLLSDLLYTMQRYYMLSGAKNNLNTLIVIDECRSVFPKKSEWSDDESDTFLERFITTARSSGIGRITITQEPHNVTDWLPDNSAYFLSFPIAGRSIESLKMFMNLSNEQLAYIPKLAKRGEGIFRDRRFDRPYLVGVPNDLDDSPILKAEAERVMKPYMESLIQKYTIAIKPEPARVKTQTYNDDQINYWKDKIWQDTKAILEKLWNDPFLNHTALFNVMHQPKKKFHMSIEWLLKMKFIKAIKCKSSKTREATFYPLTIDGFRLLDIPENKRRHGAHMFKHDYYCKRVYENLKKRKLSPVMEYLPENLKSLGARGRIDVYCKSKKGKHYANEITLSFSNLIGNINKCDAAKMDVITIICDGPTEIDDAKTKVENANIKTKAEIKYMKINQYL